MSKILIGLRSSEFKFLLTSYLVWRIILFIFVFLGILLFPLQKNFLGGGLKEYLSSPFFWSWANFDGEHYLSIAKNGYGLYEQAFFPLFPMLIKIISISFSRNLIIYNISGILISHTAFLFAIMGLYKLVKHDFSEKIAKLSIITLLIFPTSFYFVSVYTESLFFALIVWAFYFFKKNKILFASLLGLLASATRFTGFLLFPIFILILLKKNKFKFDIVNNIKLFLIPVGLIVYMFYLQVTFGDPFAFFNSLSGFGEQRSIVPIVLPQVFFRYIFKIFPNLNYNYFPSVFTTILEFSTAFMFLILSVVSLIKLKFEYFLYLAIGFIIPTLTGSFSSLPRYVLVLFPGFILLALWVSKISKVSKILVFTFMFVLLFFATALFVRGYWVS